MALKIDKGLLLDVFDMYLIDTTTGKVIFVQENLTSSAIKGSADEKEVRNGKGNSLFATLSSNKTLEITCVTNTFDFASLAFLAGTSVHTGTGVSYCPVQELKLTGGKLTLAKAPVKSAEVSIFKNGVEVTGATIAGTQVTITGGTDGDVYRVLPYGYASTANAEEITIKADEFPSAVKCVLKGVERDKNSKVVADMSFIFERAKPTTDFSIETSSELDAKDTTMTLKVLNNNGTLATIVREPITV